VGALQETKLFECGLYEVGGGVVLASGKNVHSVSETVQREEGVALVLMGQASGAWRRGDSNGRDGVQGVCQQSCRRIRARITMHVVSCYAPTRTASREVKDAFFQELESIIFSMPSGETYILLGDFSARVGSRENTDDEWRKVRGPHGLGAMNDSGRELLSFLSTKLRCAKHGLKRKEFISRRGSIRNPRNGAVLTLL
jgi:hypothetical protein